SFADKTTLKFGRGITAVVGPNGSGKSNISDAVRWVLGEQSTKNLRGQSMEDVIFGGTADRRPHGYCEVTLVIDNSDRSLNFDNDTVAITRRYYRSHESEYLINNVSVRLRDVNELFMDTGLGRDGYSMIGQGKIDTIISSKSHERRDIFEEASGISKYRYRKLEAERKLAAADDNMVRLRDILGELEGRVGPLEEQSKKAEKFLKFAAERKELEIGLWMHTLNNSKDSIRNQESKIAVAEAQYSDADNQLKQMEADLEGNSEGFAKLTSDIDNMRARAAFFEEQAVALSGNIAVLENTIAHNKETIARIEEEIANIADSDASATEEIAKKSEEIAEKQARISALELKVAETGEQLSNLLSDSESISKNIEDLSKSLNELMAKGSDERVKMVTAQSSIDEIGNRAAVIDEVLAEKLAEIKALDEELDETNKLLDEIEDSISSCNNSIKGYELRKEARKETVDKLKADIDETTLEIESKLHKIQVLEDLEKNMEGFNHSVKKVMSDAEKGLLRGIYGPVSRIINVDSEYAVAIEVALGNAMQNIVTETDADAKRAIEMLKKGNHGRATFLPVATMRAKKYETEEAEKHFGFIGVASDLVKCDDKYREIIKYLLGGTIVADDLDSAATIAKKTGYKLKVVSLDGQVVNPGGSLTGGSLSKQAGILSRSGEIEKLKTAKEKLEEKLEKLTVDHTAAAQELAAVEADIVAANAVLTTANEDKIRALAELRRISELKNSAQAAYDAAADEKQNSAAKVAEHTAAIEQCNKAIAEIEEQKAAIQAEIDSKTGGRDDLAANRERVANMLTEYRLSIVEIEKDIENLKSVKQSLENAVGNRLERGNILAAEKDELLTKNTELGEQIEKIKSDIEALRQSKTDAEAETEALINARSEMEKNSHDMRVREREILEQKETLSGELARLNERRESMLRELDDVVKRLYDEYQLTRTEAEEMGIVIENVTEAKKTLAELKSKIRSLGHVNVAAIDEYKEVSERYNFLSEQVADVERSRAELNKLIAQLTGQMQELFTEGFEKISSTFSKTFKELFGGGQAELSLSDPTNILESGIDINVKLPGKNVPSLDGLSGGEKALIALSIYFSIMRVNAPPFCFLDEVDTALDDINVDRVADYMSRADFNTQFICITHRRGTMEAADMLYGVTMQEKGITKLLELNVSELEKKMNLN
ncbi:MAG: chromosome segregation protein SMC, partial [Clostridia bacterium]|nr:chromosome segregation protein SMC [Clostridia bacterium]